jgi:hypothetical protein
MDFTSHELSIIYNAVKYFQDKKLSKELLAHLNDPNLSWECDLIIKKLYPKITINGMEPAYRSDI